MLENATKKCNIKIRIRSKVVRVPPQMKKHLVLCCKCHARKYAAQPKSIQELESRVGWTQKSRLGNADDFQTIQFVRHATTRPSQVDIGIGKALGAIDRPVSRGYIGIGLHSSIGNQPFFSADTNVRYGDPIPRKHNALDLDTQTLSSGLGSSNVSSK